MNRLIPRIGAATVSVTVFLFALCLIVDWTFGSYLVCMFLPLGWIMMAAGFLHESPEDRRVPALAGLALAAVYTVLILLVYYAQTTTVRLESLPEPAIRILDYRQGGLMFNYDLLGYGIMALSTFFSGLSMAPGCKRDRRLKALMLIHGVFFLSCFFLPMTGMFTGMAGSGGKGGTYALLVWCAFFLPIGILGIFHFSAETK